MNNKGKEYGKESIYRYIKLKQCAGQQRSKHCKSTILQQKKKKFFSKDYRALYGELKTLKGAGENQNSVRRGARARTVSGGPGPRGSAQVRSQQQGHGGDGGMKDKSQGDARSHELLTGF